MYLCVAYWCVQMTDVRIDILERELNRAMTPAAAGSSRLTPEKKQKQREAKSASDASTEVEMTEMRSPKSAKLQVGGLVRLTVCISVLCCVVLCACVCVCGATCCVPQTSRCHTSFTTSGLTLLRLRCCSPLLTHSVQMATTRRGCPPTGSCGSKHGLVELGELDFGSVVCPQEEARVLPVLIVLWLTRRHRIVLFAGRRSRHG